MHNAVPWVDIANPHGAQLASPHPRHRNEPYVQRDRVLPAGAGLADHLHNRRL